MKHLKKLIAAALTMFVALAMAVPALAADTGTITVSNPVEGETYTLYKVFDATVADGRVDGGNGISYKSNWLTESNDYFEVDSKGNITITDAGKGADGTLSTEAIAWLKSQVSNFTQIGEPIEAGTVQWTGLADGYYYVNTTTGSFVTVDSITPNANVQEKNTVPTIDKQQSEEDGTGYADTLLELNIGDIVYYSTTVTIGKGSDKEIVITDVMTAGLTFDQDSIAVTDVDGPLDTSAYTVTGKTEQGFTLTLTEDYVKAHSEGSVTITYEAAINENAVVDDAEGNDNTVTMTYSNQTSEDTVYVATYDFLLKKTDGTNYLPGAGFKLYDALTEGNLIKVNKDDTGYYLDAEADEEILVDNADGVNVRGLKPGTYYLEETTTPDGYNTLTARQPVVVTAGQTNAVEVEVVNNAGAELPSTGGMGTTILYIIGGILVVGGGIYLLTKKRMGKE